MSGRPTIQQVAAAAKVSASTVSRVFNQPHLLKMETVTRVQHLAEEMGYVPNRFARAMVTGHTNVLGLVVPDITNPFFPPLVRAAQREAETYGMSVTLAETDSVPDRELAQLAVLGVHCEGVIIASSRLTAEELRQFAKQTKVVLINNDTDGLARVLVSSARGLEEGIRQLSSEGARRFLYVGGPNRSWSEGERSSTVQRVAEELGLTASYVRNDSGTYAEARNMAASMSFDADAIVAFDDIIACGVLDGLSDRGILVPEDVRLLGCDDALPVQTRPRLSTVRLDGPAGVREAVALLAACKEPVVPEARVVIPGTLTMRET